MSKTFDFDADNTSDHQPIILKLDYKTQLSNDQPVVIPVRKQKVHWSNFSQEAINTIYVDLLLFDLSTLVWPETSDLNELVEFISDLLLKNSLPLVAPRSSRSSCRKKRKFGVYASLPYDVKEARASCKDAFETWKQVDFSAESDEHDAYKAKRKAYRLSMRSFLNQLESDRVTKLCSAADSDEKLFWKFLKGQKPSSQMSAFFVNGSLIILMKFGTCGLTTLKRWEPPRKVLPMIMVLPLKFLPMLRSLLKHVLMTPGVFLTSHLLMMKSLTSAPSWNLEFVVSS